MGLILANIFIFYPRAQNPNPPNYPLPKNHANGLSNAQPSHRKPLLNTFNGKTCNAVSILGDLETKGVLERIGRNPLTKQVTFRLKADDSKLQAIVNGLINLQNDVTVILNGLPETGYNQLQARQMLSQIRGKIEKVLSKND